jgi:hypothetical protein
VEDPTIIPSIRVVQRVVKSNEIVPPTAEVTESIVVKKIDDDPKRALNPPENEMIDDHMIDNVHEVTATRHHRIVIVVVVAARHHRIVIVVALAVVNDDPTHGADHETSHNDEVPEGVTVLTVNDEPPIETLIEIGGLDPAPEPEDRTTTTDHDDIDRNPGEQDLEMSSTRRIAIEKVVDDVDHNHEIDAGRTRLVAENPTIMTTTFIMTTIVVDEIDGIVPALDPEHRPVVIVTRGIPTGDGIDPDPEHRPVVVTKMMRMAGDGIDPDPEHRPVVVMRMMRLTIDGVEKKRVPDHEHHTSNESEMSQIILTRTTRTIRGEDDADLLVETVMTPMTITTTTNERDFDPGHDDLKWKSSEVIVDPLRNDLNPIDIGDIAIDPNQERGVQTRVRMKENLGDHPDRPPTMLTTIKAD